MDCDWWQMVERFPGRLVSAWTDLTDGSIPFDRSGHNIVEPFPLSL